MSIVIDATVAGANANSYVTLAEMENFMAETIPGAVKTAWNALGDEPKKAYLIQAAKQIDRWPRTLAPPRRWKGWRVTNATGADDQALEHPRVSRETWSGSYNIDRTADPIVDRHVKDAQLEQCRYLVRVGEVDGAPDPGGPSVREKLQAEGVTSINIGNTAETYNGQYSSLCQAAESLLKPLITRLNSM